MNLFGFFFRNKKQNFSENSTGNHPLDSWNTKSKNISKPYGKAGIIQNKYIKHLYENPQNIIEIEFSNRTNTLQNIWVEPICLSIELDSKAEYKVVTHDKSFRIEFDEKNQVVFYLQYTFGFKLYKRLTSLEVINGNQWIIDEDYSEIN